MSTRATYQLPNGDAGDSTMYIHADGYPEGAAVYFLRMHHAAYKGGLAERFLRSNEEALLTESHEAIGDTEYRYTVKDDGSLTVMRWTVGAWQTHGRWSHYAEFINETLAAYDEFERLHKIQPGYSAPVWMTLTQARRMRDEAVQKHDEYAAEFPQYTGNIASLASRRDEWQRIVEQIESEEAAA